MYLRMGAGGSTNLLHNLVILNKIKFLRSKFPCRETLSNTRFLNWEQGAEGGQLERVYWKVLLERVYGNEIDTQSSLIEKKRVFWYKFPWRATLSETCFLDSCLKLIFWAGSCTRTPWSGARPSTRKSPTGTPPGKRSHGSTVTLDYGPSSRIKYLT